MGQGIKVPAEGECVFRREDCMWASRGHDSGWSQQMEVSSGCGQLQEISRHDIDLDPVAMICLCGGASVCCKNLVLVGSEAAG